MDNILQFYSILQQICKATIPRLSNGVLVTDATPEELKQYNILRCSTINSFVVLKRLEDLEADNLYKDKRYIDSPYFYSRAFENNGSMPSDLSHNYPLLFVIDNGENLNNAFTSRFNKDANLTLCIVDKMPVMDSIQTDDNCGNRLMEDIGNDLRNLMQGVLMELVDFKKYNILGIHTWLHTSQNQSHEEVNEMTDFLLNKQNQNIESSLTYEATTNNLIEYWIRLTVNIGNCERLNTKYDSVDIDKLQDRFTN